MNKVNFTYKVKKEIYFNVIENHDLKYVVSGILFNHIQNNEDNESDFIYLTSNFDIIKIIKTYFSNSEIIKQKTKCEIIFKLDYKIKDIWTKINNLVINDLNKIHLFFSGLFLDSGSVSDPLKSYHLEIRVNKQSQEIIKWIFKKININFTIIDHNNKVVFYIKKNDVISDVLKILKANECMFYFEECKISKDFNASIQRINNLDISNINKQIKGSQEIISIINFLSNTTIFNQLDPLILLYCEERKKYPEYSIKQLVENLNNKFDKNVTKSWINHVNIKLRKIYMKYK